jgi:hypothetical protein
LQGTAAAGFGPRVAGLRQFDADLLGQGLDVPGGDGQAEQFQGEGGIREGVQAGASRDDLAE